MGVQEILAQIDDEIAQLQQARALLMDGTVKKGRNIAVPAVRKIGRRKRNLTPDGRKRIAEAVKKRWAEQKKSASTK